MLLAYQIGHKSFIGCVACVRKKVLAEAGLSALIGWFSITALLINPFLIVYNLLQGVFLREKRNKVSQKLQELGIPENLETIDLTSIGYTLAVSMIKADGKVEEAEIEMAEKIGERIFEDFDEAKFRLLVQENKRLPATKDLAILLKDALNQEGRTIVFEYLAAIAQADGHIDTSEQHMLIELARILEISLPQQVGEE